MVNEKSDVEADVVKVLAQHWDLMREGLTGNEAASEMKNTLYRVNHLLLKSVYSSNEQEAEEGVMMTDLLYDLNVLYEMFDKIERLYEGRLGDL